jgi:hypothetical protein
VGHSVHWEVPALPGGTYTLGDLLHSPTVLLTPEYSSFLLYHSHSWRLHFVEALPRVGPGRLWRPGGILRAFLEFLLFLEVSYTCTLFSGLVTGGLIHGVHHDADAEVYCLLCCSL